MKSSNKNNPKNHVLKLLYLFIFCLCLAYSLVIFKDANILRNIKESKNLFFVINFSIAIPEMIIWAVAFTSSFKLKLYSNRIIDSKEGLAMRYLSDSLLLMTIYIVMICIASNVSYLFINSASLKTMILLENYLPLSIGLASAGLLLLASRQFTQLASSKISKTNKFFRLILFLTFSGLLLWHFRELKPGMLHGGIVPRFVLPDTALLFSYVLPQILIWAIGIHACFKLANYTYNVKGVIYKNLLNNLYKGVIMLFICIYLSQILVISALSLNHINLSLILIYLLLIIGGSGFLLVYKGTNNLTKLERI
jgi:hypothetical protein